MNFHDKNGEIDSKLVLKEFFNENKLFWREINEEILRDQEAFYLSKIVKSIFLND